MSKKDKKPIGVFKGAILGGLGVGFTAIMIGQKFFPAIEKSPDKTNKLVGIGFALGALLGGYHSFRSGKKQAVID